MYDSTTFHPTPTEVVQHTSDDSETKNDNEDQSTIVKVVDDMYSKNAFIVNCVLPKLKSNISDFRATMIINNCIGKPISDTGAKVSVCSQAKQWNLLSHMVPSTAKLKLHTNSPIPILWTARCAVTFGFPTIPVEWHIISGSCQPILSGNSALQPGIIKFSSDSDMFHLVLMINNDTIGDEKEQVQPVLQQHPQNFMGLGRLKNTYQNLSEILLVPHLTTDKNVRAMPYRRCRMIGSSNHTQSTSQY